MKNKDRLIFVTNDDGYQAKGFEAALEVAREFGRVLAVAPATAQSGKSQAITMYDPLFLDKRRSEEGLEVYSFSGTPVDCVKVTFDHLIGEQKVDLVISGINHGSNAATNVLYSGTMGAAIEGSFYGVPSVGLSLTSHDTDADFEAAKEYARRIISSLLEREGSEQNRGICLNVNIPDIKADEIRGIRICRQCRGLWKDEFFRHEDPRGRTYFWLSGGFSNAEPYAEDTDEWALSNGYVAVVPVQIDLTDYKRVPYLQDILAKVTDQ
ncbi:MAG: 5'/3'-nucleotidase SurE [Alistipes sp.]|nr:5'/3'-nucleotidase SurE [Alistipes sp.]